MGSATALAEARPEVQRRSYRRYPITTEVSYQLVRKGKTVCEGRGRSVNMSSCGVLIATETDLPVGLPIALQIAWPAKLDKFVRLNLHVRGCTVRSSGNRTAITITHYEFHTRRQAQFEVVEPTPIRARLSSTERGELRAYLSAKNPGLGSTDGPSRAFVE